MDDQTRNLFRAVKREDANAVSWAIVSGADINAANPVGHQILHYAASKGREIAEILLDMDADLEARDFWGNTPLHLAVCECNHAVVKLFIERGAEVNAKDREGNAPLHLAAQHCGKESVELMAKAGADLDARNELGLRPVDLAHGETKKLLEKEMELAGMRKEARKVAAKLPAPRASNRRINVLLLTSGREAHC